MLDSDISRGEREENRGEFKSSEKRFSTKVLGPSDGGF